MRGRHKQNCKEAQNVEEMKILDKLKQMKRWLQYTVRNLFFHVFAYRSKESEN